MSGQDKVNRKNILVIGDVMLDEYVLGVVNRVSPESGCPVFLEGERSYRLGGAANVAYQLYHLGCAVYLCGIIGKDKTSSLILQKLCNNDIRQDLLFAHDGINTTRKCRYVNEHQQQMFRVDCEQYVNLSTPEIESVTTFMSENRDMIKCIILSDYHKGVLTTESCQTIINCANQYNIPTIVDIKVPDASKYHGATIIKGNLKELAAFFPEATITNNNVEEYLRKLKGLTDVKSIVVTLGRDGIAGIDCRGSYVYYPAYKVMVYDVTGAGDTITSYMGALLNEIPFEDMLQYANRAAGIKVTRFGNSCVTFDEVNASQDKVKTVEQVAGLSKGKKVVFTNGCFDILHAGHIDLLKHAKSKGDILVVGLNTDESIKRLKGDNRPINSLDMRVKVLSAIGDVDYIICFDEDTPEAVIKALRPTVLIKGGDYNVDNIVGADFVLGYGGAVEAMPFHYNTSTTSILSRL